MHDAPRFDPRASAYLLDAVLTTTSAKECVVVAVVDPGVGTDSRACSLARGGRASNCRTGQRPARGGCAAFQVSAKVSNRLAARQLSSSFHGRDLFLPVAVKLSAGNQPAAREIALCTDFDATWPADLDEIIYIDDFGNAVTGLRSQELCAGEVIEVDGRAIPLRAHPLRMYLLESSFGTRTRWGLSRSLPTNAMQASSCRCMWAPRSLCGGTSRFGSACCAVTR